MYCDSSCKCMKMSTLYWSLSALCFVFVLLCCLVDYLVSKGRPSAGTNP